MYLVHLGRGGPWTTRQLYHRTEQLANIDIAAAASAIPPATGEKHGAPMYLVYTREKGPVLCGVRTADHPPTIARTTHFGT
jgi:hypothetical protein